MNPLNKILLLWTLPTSHCSSGNSFTTAAKLCTPAVSLSGRSETETLTKTSWMVTQESHQHLSEYWLRYWVSMKKPINPPTHTNPRHIEKKKFWVFSCDKGMTVALNASLNMCQLMQGGAATLCRRRTDSEVPWDSDWFRGQTDAPVTPLKSKNKSHIVLLWPCALCVSWCGKTFKYFYYPVRRGKPTYHP